MLWAGIIVAGIGVILFFVGRAQSDKVYQMKVTDTSNAAELAKLAQDVDAELGANSFAETAELKGVAKSDEPLVAEMSGTPCVYYTVSVTREYEESYYETDSEGRKQLKTRRGSESVSSNTRSGPFYLDDGSGRIEIDPEGAAIEAIKTFDRFDSGEGSGSVAIGNFTLNLARALTGGGGRRTIGYKYQESSIPLDRRLYVLGEASNMDGRLKVRKPRKKGERFIISTRSEEEMVAAAEKGAKWLTIGAGVAAIGGAVLFALSFLR